MEVPKLFTLYRLCGRKPLATMTSSINNTNTTPIPYCNNNVIVKDIAVKHVMWWFIRGVMNLSVLNVRESIAVLLLLLKILTNLKSPHTGRVTAWKNWRSNGQFQFTDILWSLWFTNLWSYSTRFTMPALYHAKGFHSFSQSQSVIRIY